MFMYPDNHVKFRESGMYTYNPEQCSYHRLCLTSLLRTVLKLGHAPLPSVGPFISTCLESPPFPHTLGAAHYRHSVVVGGVSSEPLRESDGGHSTLGGGGVPVDQVGVGWVCTIVNSAGVSWLKCALHKCIAWISCVNMDTKNTCTTCERRT